MKPKHHYCCQCRDLKSGTIGCFIMEGTSFRAISPVLNDLADLYLWMRNNGWVAHRNPADPWECERITNV